MSTWHQQHGMSTWHQQHGMSTWHQQHRTATSLQDKLIKIVMKFKQELVNRKGRGDVSVSQEHYAPGACAREERGIHGGRGQFRGTFSNTWGGGGGT